MTTFGLTAFMMPLIKSGDSPSDDEDENDKFIITQLKTSKHLARTCQELHNERLIARAYLLDTVNWHIGDELLRGPYKYEALEHMLEIHYPLHYREVVRTSPPKPTREHLHDTEMVGKLKDAYTREVKALQQLIEQRGRKLLELEALAAANLNEQEHLMVQQGVQDI
ncbi:hypothetical protein UCRNP2_6105 [Neofusicoccum parvum UCRNP2]|uniref:Uncharacterized protein n=1 Tax=Botryosphaeria parva (strain UCR-NP2) TaxID=1287680 RepID=R1EI01_BOTPV|nr:hypothetical protein UCRNP2_6105 [Neofusicoccum parvum UCRNP2]